MQIRALGLLAFLAVLFSAVLAAQPVPFGPEFLVNTSTTSWPGRVSAAMDPSGEFTVVWVAVAGTFPPFADAGIHGQRFSASGAKLGDEFQVNTDTTASEWGEASVAKDSAGNFIVVWSAKTGT